MKNIYIVLAHTGTLMSRIIRIFMKDEVSHVSISLDKELKEMYSFGRLNPYNAFIGGFVHEYIDKGTFKRFKNTRASIYSLEITDEQYQNIENIIRKFEKEKEDYIFNIIGMFAVWFKKKIKRKNSFYCAEFVKYVIETSGIETNLPELVRPESFKNIPNLQKIYSGLLRKYQYEKIDIEKITV